MGPPAHTKSCNAGSTCLDDCQHSNPPTPPENAAADSSYYHFDSKGNKFKNKWENFDVDAECAKVDGAPSKSQPASKQQSSKPKKEAVDNDGGALQFDPKDPMYKDMEPGQLEAVKMALSVSDEQIKAMPEKDRDMLTQFRQIHRQRMRSGMNMKPSPNAKDVKEELKKQRDAKAKEVKDPEEELKKLFTFLGTDKKWSSETMPSSAGDGEARCPSEVSMIAETKKQELKNAEINRLRVQRERWSKENTPPSSPLEEVGSVFQDPSKLLGKITHTKSEAVRKKGKKKSQKDRKKQFSAIKKLASSKPFDF